MRSYHCYSSNMAVTQKISVAIGRDELRLARVAAEQEGVSLSAYFTRAVRRQLDEQRRMEAARKVLATFAPEDFPTPEEQRALVAVWTRPRPGVTTSGRQRPTRRRRAS